MAEIVNLRTARKARARSGKDAAASASRRLFGQTKEERRAVREEQSRIDRTLDSAKRETD